MKMQMFNVPQQTKIHKRVVAMAGLSFFKRVTKFRNLPAVFVSGAEDWIRPDQAAIEDVVATVRAGARGYVTKTVSPGDLAEAIRRVVDGDAVFSPKLAGFVLDAFAAGEVKDW